MISLKSKITGKILNYLFINPDDSLYINEMVEKFSVDKRNLIKKLRELEKEGIVANETRGNLKLYSINPHYPLYKELKNILMKTAGFEEIIRKVISGIPGIKKALIFGSYAKNKMEVHSDIDILVVGSHNTIKLQKELSKIQKALDREINMISMDENEYRKRIKNKDPFLSNIIKEKNIQIK